MAIHIKKQDRIVKITPLQKEEINDENDVKKHVLIVHNESIKDMLSNDLVMGKLDDKDREFIRGQIFAANEGMKYIRDKRTARQAMKTLLIDAYATAILKRNQSDNWIVDLVVKGGKDLGKEVASIDDEVLEKLDKEK